MNKRMITMSLLGSSSSLGLNWIYDKELMSSFSKKNEVLFLPIQHQLYNQAKNGFNVYKNHKIGDLDFMGEVMYIFHKFLISNKNNSNFKEFLYQHIGPDSEYDGYIEQYGKELIKSVSNGKLFTDHVDKQLIGCAMFIIGYAHNLEIDTIHNYTKVLTAYDQTLNFIHSLNYIFNNINETNKTSVLKESIKFLGNDYKGKMEASLTKIDIDEFIKNYSGIACGLEQSFPLIFYIVNISNTYKDALRVNSSLGGASSARGLVIGAIYSITEEVPIDFKSILNKKI